jgi:hypothetical protein
MSARVIFVRHDALPPTAGPPSTADGLADRVEAWPDACEEPHAKTHHTGLSLARLDAVGTCPARLAGAFFSLEATDASGYTKGLSVALLRVSSASLGAIWAGQGPGLRDGPTIAAVLSAKIRERHRPANPRCPSSRPGAKIDWHRF